MSYTPHFLPRLRAFIRRTSWPRLAILGVAGAILVVLLFFGVLLLGVLTERYGPLPDRTELAGIRNDEASSIITADGKLLGKYYAVNRTSVPAGRISPHVTEALIATEDARFFEHRGIDARALVRVAIRTVLLGDRSGGGGSTISQQLAKHLYPRQRYDRLGILKMKLREMVIASRLEKVYTKEELLNFYLNTVPFGENAYGIEVAANRYFGKPAADLRREEAAVLVGLLKANTTYNPRLHPEASRGRRDVVLGLMAINGALTEAQADSLQALPLELNYRAQYNRIGSAAYFRSHLRAAAIKALAGLEHPDGRPYDLDRDGLRIHVTLDSRLQRMAEEAVHEQLPAIQANFATDWQGRSGPWQRAFKAFADRSLPPGTDRETPRPMTIYDGRRGRAVDTLLSPLDSLRHYFTLLNAGLLATEPATNTVRAWVGGVDHRFVQYDHVTSRRQVGSTIKPVVYATALQQGLPPCEYTAAERLRYVDYDDYTPGNANGEYVGAYSMRGALAKSVNTIAVNLAVRSGLETLTHNVHAMGVEAPVQPLPSVALGTVEASLAEMTTVYATLANGGRRPGALHFLSRIENAGGKVLWKAEASRGKGEGPLGEVRVLSERDAAVTTYLMAGVVNHGTGARLRSTYGLRGPLAGKTGTTQNQSDGWFLGFTPKLVVGTWVGAELPAVHFRSLYRGSATRTALPVWGSFLRRVQADKELRGYLGGSFPRLDEMTLALLDCPDYLDELPREQRPGFVEELIDGLRGKRRNDESVEDYARRREGNRPERRAERERRKKSWIKRLFGGGR